MNNFFVLSICLLVFTGCSHTGKMASPASGAMKIIQNKGGKSSRGVELVTPPRPGIVFAKTIFEGVVQASYVRLSFIERSLPQKVYRLYIGDKVRQQGFPWVGEAVHPDYFLIDLPPGQYRIIEIAIPVGTTLAHEPMDVEFTVESGKGIYLGTMHVKGTKERVKLGGVPLIQPGFEYELDIRDERENALAEFRRRIPDFHSDLKVLLMQDRRIKRFNLPTAQAGNQTKNSR